MALTLANTAKQGASPAVVVVVIPPAVDAEVVVEAIVEVVVGLVGGFWVVGADEQPVAASPTTTSASDIVNIRFTTTDLHGPGSTGAA
jgi:hypothetical protein